MSHNLKALTAALATGALLCIPCTARSQPLTQQQGDEILKELRGIRQALETLIQRMPTQPPNAGAARPADVRVKLTDISGHALGRADAPLTIVEFTDLQCPFCSRFANATFDELRTKYIDTGKVRYIARDLPLPQLHPYAQRAAIAARCAGEQNADKYWDMRMRLVKNAASLNPQFIASTAEELKLDMPAFNACVASGRFDAEIQKDAAAAASVGITGTPSFVLGRASGAAIEGLRIVGAQPLSSFDAILKQLAADGGSNKAPGGP